MTGTAGSDANQEPYARTRRKEARLRAMVARAHIKHNIQKAYEAALAELLTLGMTRDAAVIQARTRVQALRAYLQATQRVAGAGRPDEERDDLRAPTQILIQIGVPEVRARQTPPAPALPPPTTNGHEGNGKHEEDPP